MAKRLNLIINYCDECPYCSRSGYYSCHEDSGYDCYKGNFRIVNDKDLAEIGPWKNRDFSFATYPIPENCPLENNE